MKIEQKNILLVSPEPWDHIFVSKHHYAVNLAKKDNRVFFLGPPSRQVGIEVTDFENVFLLRYKGFFKGLRFLPAFIRRHHIASVFRRLEKLCNVTFHIVWSFDNSVFYDFSALPSSVLTICHIVDLNQNFQTSVAASTAEICLASTTLIQERLLNYNKKVYQINHGFNEVKNPLPVSLPGSSRVKAIYLGNLSMPYIDWAALYEIVTAHHEVDFLFIGPNAEVDSIDTDKKKLFLQRNVVQVGKISADLIPSYLADADVLLISYKEEFFDEQANPHKMMEYLGSGKVIVATFTREYEGCRDFIQMADRNSELPVIFARVVANLEAYNQPDLAHRRRSFALGNTYIHQIERIERIVDA